MTPQLIPSYTVISRHSSDCAHKKEGREYRYCDCRKHIYVVDPRIPIEKRQDFFLGPDGTEKRTPFSVKTRSWQEAEQIAQIYRDSHNLDKVRAAEAEAKLKSMEQKTETDKIAIEKAVLMFLTAKRKEGISEKRLERYLPLLGDVDPATVTFKANRRGNKGRLATWLETLNPKPVHASDLTPTLIEEFRNSWDFGSDLTDFGTFGDLKRFLQYCNDKGWTKLSISRRQLAGIDQPDFLYHGE